MSKKQEFLTEISHEIRTPLNSLAGLNQLMRYDMEDREALGKYIQESQEILDYLVLLTDNMLDMAKLEQKNMVLDKAPLSLEQLLRTVEIIMRKRILAKNINYQIGADWKCPCIIGDGVRIKQVLVNIVENAVKFTPENGKIQIDVTQEMAGEQMITTIFRISDNGCGIGEEFIGRTFDFYTQEKRNIKHNPHGTGLGMAISYRLMKEMGGDIQAAGKMGAGSCFTVILPARICENGLEDLFREEAEPEGTVLGKKNILVAEDDRLNAEILMGILKRGGHHVSWAENGKEVLERFQSSEPGEIDIILMDLKMPVMDGYETAKTIRALEREDAGTVRIYACTAGVYETDGGRAEECGMNGCVAKPIRTQDLFRLVNGQG